MSDMLGTPEVAERFKVSEATARRWCQRGLFPNARRIGKTWVIPASDLEGFERPRPGPKRRERED